MNTQEFTVLASNVINRAKTDSLYEEPIFNGQATLATAEVKKDYLEIEIKGNHFYSDFEVFKDLYKVSSKILDSYVAFNYANKFETDIEYNGVNYLIKRPGLEDTILKLEYIQNQINPDFFLGEKDYTTVFQHIKNNYWNVKAKEYLEELDILPESPNFNIGDIEVSLNSDESMQAILFIHDVAGYVELGKNGITLRRGIEILNENRPKIQELADIAPDRFIGSRFIDFTFPESPKVKEDNNEYSFGTNYVTFMSDNEIPEQIQEWYGRKSLPIETDNVSMWIKMNQYEVHDGRLQIQEGVDVLHDGDGVLHAELSLGSLVIKSAPFDYQGMVDGLNLFMNLYHENKERYAEMYKLTIHPDNIEVQFDENNGERTIVDNNPVREGWASDFNVNLKSFKGL